MKTAIRNGYTMIETLIAAGILLIGISAAAMLSWTVLGNEEGGTIVMRALNQQEQAAKLYHLGLSPAQISALLLNDNSVVSLAISTPADSVNDGVTTVRTTLSLSYRGGGVMTSSTDPDGTATASETLVLFRPKNQ